MGYIELKRKHQEEWNQFPMVFAFNRQQFKEGLEKLGLKETETSQLYRFGDTGGYYKKDDSPKLRAMIDRHDKEMAEGYESPEFAFEMFKCELANHEFCITWRTEDALAGLGFSEEDIQENPVLKEALKKAIDEYRQSL